MSATATLPVGSVCETLSSSERKARAWLSTNILALRNTTWPRPDVSLQSRAACSEQSVSGKWAQVQVYNRSPDDPTRSVLALSNTTERCTHSRAPLSLILQFLSGEQHQPRTSQINQPASMQVALLAAVAIASLGSSSALHQVEACTTPLGGYCGNAQGAYCQPWNANYYQCLSVPERAGEVATDTDYPDNDIDSVSNVYPKSVPPNASRTLRASTLRSTTSLPEGRRTTSRAAKLAACARSACYSAVASSLRQHHPLQYQLWSQHQARSKKRQLRRSNPSATSGLKTRTPRVTT